MSTKNIIYLKLVTIVILTILAIILLNLENIYPNTKSLYSLKRLSENFYLNLKQTPNDKIDYQLTLLQKRLNELKYFVNSGNYAKVLEASSRYSTNAGKITEQIVSLGLKNESKKAQAVFKNQQKEIEQLIDIYPKDNSELKYLIDSKNYLGIYLDKLASI